MSTRLRHCLASILLLSSACDWLDDSDEAAGPPQPNAAENPETKTGTAEPEPEPAPESAPSADPDPPTAKARTFTLAMRSDVHLTPIRTTDGTILIHAAGKMARIEDGRVVEVPHSGPTKAMDERDVFLDHFGGRWPDAIFSCWMAGLPNDPGRPLLLRFDPSKGWTKVSNGGGKNKWCYEGFAASSSGALLSRKIAHDYEEEQFALGPFVTDDRKPGFAIIDGSGSVSNPALPFVADWTVGEDGEIWAVTGSELVQLVSGKAPARYALPEPVARRSSAPLRVTFADGTLYVHGKSREGPYLAHWKDGALDPIELPEAIQPPESPEVYAEPIHVADVQIASNGELWMLAGRILWMEVSNATLWHKTDDEWGQVDPVDPTQLDPKVNAELTQYESVGGFVLDGEDLWVTMRTFRYGMDSSGVLLTTKNVDKALAWTLLP